MSTRKYASLLEDAADRIADISRPDLQIMLRRAALRLRNTGSIALEEDIEKAVADVGAKLGMTRNDLLRYIVREWLISTGNLTIHMLEEHSEVDGNA
jgi:hypothetical protein